MKTLLQHNSDPSKLSQVMVESDVIINSIVAWVD